MARTMKEVVAEYNRLAPANGLPEKTRFKSIVIGENAILDLKQPVPESLDTSLTTKDMTSRIRSAPVQDPVYPCTRVDAIRKGYVLYWTGKQCSSGHEAPRYTKTGACRKCYQMFRSEEISQSEIDKDKFARKKRGDKNVN